MRDPARTVFRLLLIGLFLLSGVMLAVSPTRYKVDLDSLATVWGDVFRDLDSVARTVRISTDLEIRFGKEIAARTWVRPGPAADRNYVTAVGERVAAGARRKDLPWTFHVVRAGYANAWAILGGQIYITTGMLDRIDSEAELAAVLGHEIAHVDLYHCVDLVQNRMILEHVGLGSIGQVVATAEDFVRVGYSEVEEKEADRYGMILAAKAGYSPLNAFDTFHRFYLDEEAASAPARPSGGPEGEILSSLGGFLTDYFDTHPPFRDRLDALRTVLDANAAAWEGHVFRIGGQAYAKRDAAALAPGETGKGGESRTFSVKAADYLALRTELAYLLGRDAEAARYFGRMTATYPKDDRIERLKALLSSRAVVAAPKAAPPATMPAEKAAPEPKPAPPKAEPAPPRAEPAPPDREPLDAVAATNEAWRDFFEGDYAQAIRKLKSVLGAYPEDGDALERLAWIYVSAGYPQYRDPRAAIQLISRSLKIGESSTRYDTLGAAYVLAGMPRHAMGAYANAVDLNADYAKSLRQDLIFLGYTPHDTTLTALSEALARALDHGQAPFLLADSLARINRLWATKAVQAAAELKIVSRVYPFHPDVTDMLRSHGLPTPLDEIRKLTSGGQHAEATRLARELLKTYPDDSRIKLALSTSLFQQARAEERSGNLQAAVGHYSAAIDLRDGDFASALNNRAFVRARLDQPALALADIDRALALDPENGLYHANRCLALRLLERYVDALAACDRAFEVRWPANRGNQSWIYQQRGTVRRILGDVGGAAQDFREAVTLVDGSAARSIQQLMASAGLYSGPVDGAVNPALLLAVEKCVRSDKCFDNAIRQMSRLGYFVR